MRIAGLFVALCICLGCSKNLDPELASRLIEEDVKSSRSTCEWFATVSMRGTNRYSIWMPDEQVQCIIAMVGAGLIENTGCLDHGAERCIEAFFATRNGARFTPKGVGFDCGTLKFLGVTSVTTTGNQAKVKYKREAGLDHVLLDKLKACPIDLTQEGVAERERNFHRDDTGKWSLDPRQ